MIQLSQDPTVTTKVGLPNTQAVPSFQPCADGNSRERRRLQMEGGVWGINCTAGHSTLWTAAIQNHHAACAAGIWSEDCVTELGRPKKIPQK